MEFDAAGHKHQPRQQTAPCRRRVSRHELAGLLAEVEQVALLSETEASPLTIIGTLLGLRSNLKRP